MPRSIFVLGSTLLLLSGCASSPRPVMLPDGRQGYDVRCNGVRHDVGDCMNEAAKLCGGPYQVVTRDGETVGGAAMAAPVGNGAGGVMVHGIHRSMIVECGATPTS